MPPFSGDTVELYNNTSYSRRGDVDDNDGDDDSPPPSQTSVSQTIYRTVRRSLFFNSADFEPCPGVQPVIIDAEESIHRAVVKKQVTFNLDNNERHEVLHAKDYSESERSLTWFSMEELKQIKSDSRLIVQAWHCAGGESGYCMRGLEGKKSEAYRLKRKRNKADIRFAVMTEQAKQKFATGGKILDHMRLAMVSMDCSELSRMEAQRVGVADEQAAVCDGSISMYKCSKQEAEANAELRGYDCTGLFLLAQSAYAY
ncbi:unnamed protein product [Cylindrotheca closterium]|uniref:Uncharacterized protein n=1 Tax=Cylindrotheca closterium TaxID=2856 RepID=A0AAD2CD66_9STRA|nr:unnamed protein product [Cylindrotheca closterium]